ncbi:squalene--hopene cyclase [Paenibacillus sp. LMG 31456]|uniref:Squalene--hopene cyclase n=1 Tax=Paenibacillus foliorum TaxID=2654974 RepID=A0A972GPA0_9BACL|nr:squalene--hopene cyclase [Paenibacillus foliorum]NOU94317.1 squalene--hopene cyclase [Paenibacillus foliorum]
MSVWSETNEEVRRLTERLQNLQQEDGSWRFCFDNGTLTDAYMIIVLRILELPHETLIRQLHDRIASKQQNNGAWKVYPDEDEGNLSASVDAYYALLYSGYSKKTDEAMKKAAHFITSKGGLNQVKTMLSQVFLAATGQHPWPTSLSIPLEFLLLPPSFLISFYDFSGFARVHLVPILLMASRQFTIETTATPDLSDLHSGDRIIETEEEAEAQRSASHNFQRLLDEIQSGVKLLSSLPGHVHENAVVRAEQYMLERIEPDGTLYSYATSTLLMIMALLALGYDKRHPIIKAAVHGLSSMLWSSNGKIHLQNSPSTIWDTALVSDALQKAGVSPENTTIRKSVAYLIAKQQHKLGDWSRRIPNPIPGGWGFSESNTINPDVDDSTAALRAIRQTAWREPVYRDAWNRGLNWVLSMQNKDGGWAAFEKDVNNELLTLLPIEGAREAAIDPSTADLTGRTLEFLGNTAGLGKSHAFIRRGTDWLIGNQEKDGSWYGRWGICYIYGTWAALTGMMAVGNSPEHPAVNNAVRWLLSIQNADGGWGESCTSDRKNRYVPLGASTPSHTAWAMDALIAVHVKPQPAMEKGIRQLIAQLHKEDWTTRYPTGAGLPGSFYTDYHSYRYIWPLLTLNHYIKKYDS